jgi:hypothetical protein
MDFLITVMLSGAVIFAVGYYFGFRRRKKLDNIGEAAVRRVLTE